MTRRIRNRRIYTVVKVWRGTAADARLFARLQDAQTYIQKVRQHCNLLEDDVQLFQRSIRNLPVS